MRKPILYTFLTYLACTACVFLLNELLLERQSRKDIEGFFLFSFCYLIVLTCFIYFRVLNSIDRKSGGSFRKNYSLISATVLNISFFIFAIVMSGKAFQPTEELLFSFMHIVVSFAFGSFFVRYKNQYEKITAH